MNNKLDWLANWQNSRFPWLLMAGLSYSLLAVAHYFFQEYIHMAPCEQCVYIRYSYVVMIIGGLVAAIDPEKLLNKLIGYGMGFYGIIYGIKCSILLEKISVAANSDDPFGVQGCSTEPTFHFGLPLDRWLPEWFKPTGDCGFDSTFAPEGVELDAVQKWFIDLWSNGWYLYPPAQFGTMAQATLFSYIVALVILGAMLLGWFRSGFKTK